MKLFEMMHFVNGNVEIIEEVKPSLFPSVYSKQVDCKLFCCCVNSAKTTGAADRSFSLFWLNKTTKVHGEKTVNPSYLDQKSLFYKQRFLI